MSGRLTQLLETVLAEGILHGTDSQPIYRVDGSTSRWMLDTLNFSLSARGSRIAARALLERLRTFEGRRLATYGTTGIPLLQAVIAESKGRYSGLLVRKELKSHGARQRVQGPSGSGPVIILDDSLSSGSSIRECRRHLEEHGFEVEGALVVVRFGYDGVGSLLAEDGLRAEALLDTDRDLRPRMEGEDLAPLNPGKCFPPFSWGPKRAAERLHPTVLAREAIASFLRTGSVPKSPRALDRPYDASGGVFVSLRRRDDLHERPARAGFWHFPEEPQGRLPEELLKACVLTASTLAANVERPIDVLAGCAIAVSFFSRLQPCAIGALDNERYGIVVRSRERRGVMGGALPRMPGIRDGWHQFRHAAWKNAQLYACEPYELLRHELTKCIEPGEPWQPTGVPRAIATPAWEERAAALARQWVLFHLKAGPRPAPAAFSLDGIAQLFVSPYVDGAVIGCSGDHVRDPAEVDALLDRVAEAAVADRRFESPRPASPASVFVGLSLLRLDLELGEHEDTASVMTPTRFGEQVLEVRSGAQSGILLPYVAVTHDLSPQEYADAVVAKAGLPTGFHHWTRYDCSSWVAGPAGVTRLLDGLPAREPRDGNPKALATHWATFLKRHSTLRGPPVNRYLPFADEQRTTVAGPRLAHAAWVKARLGLQREAKADLAHLKPVRGWLALEGEAPSAATLAFAALALQQLGRKRELATVTATLLGLTGARVQTAPEGTEEAAQAQDYAPGQVLYALAMTAGRGARVEDALGHYRRRFRARPEWGSVAWLTMAFAAWSRVSHERAHLDFAWELTDWALRSQAPHGGFWNDQQPDAPGATTAVYLEGFAALLPELRRAGRRGPAKQLERAIARGFDFLARLTYLPKDAPILPNPHFALGGVRTSLTSGEVRLDFVQHALSAALLLP